MNSKFKIQNSKLGGGIFKILLSLAVVCTVGLSFVVSAQTSRAALPSNAPRVSGRFEPDSIGIGDRYLYSIEVEKDLVQTVIFPDFNAMEGQQHELIEDLPVDTLERDGRRLKIRKSYLLAAFQEGWHHIRPQVMYADKNIIDTLGADRFFFATDFPMWDAEAELERFKKIPLTDEEREMIFSGNIKRVLKL